jgi:hypothetical protein
VTGEKQERVVEGLGEQRRSRKERMNDKGGFADQVPAVERCAASSV